MNPAFEQALQARLLWLQVRSYGSLGFHQMARDAAHKAYWLVEELARTQARCELPYATYAYPYGAKCPIILSDVPRLADLYEQAWSHEARVIEEEREEVQNTSEGSSRRPMPSSVSSVTTGKRWTFHRPNTYQRSCTQVDRCESMATFWTMRTVLYGWTIHMASRGA